MNIGSLVILGLILVFLFTVAVGIIEYTIPFFDKLKFNNIVNDYLSIIQKTGGLSTLERAALTTKLENIGFSNISITAPAATPWGEEASLRVTANYTFSAIGAGLLRADNTLTTTFESSTIVMTLDR